MEKAPLEAVLDVFGEELPEGVRERLRVLEALLERYGKHLSLTGFRDGEERARRYFGEALLAARFVPERGRALDVGSGGGSPALPLAVVRPQVTWLLTEPRTRKADFLREAAASLGVANVEVASRRVDRKWPEETFDVVTTRGVSLEGTLGPAVASRVAPGGVHLWFSSEERLLAARDAGGAWSYEGPLRLELGALSRGRPGSLLVRRRLSRAAENRA